MPTCTRRLPSCKMQHVRIGGKKTIITYTDVHIFTDSMGGVGER